MSTTPEQQARDMLERMGVPDAQTKSSGDVVELANLIAEMGAHRGPNGTAMQEWAESTPWEGERHIPSNVVWAALRDMYPWLPQWDRMITFETNDAMDQGGCALTMVCSISLTEAASLDAAAKSAMPLNSTPAILEAMRQVADWLPPVDVWLQDSFTIDRYWDRPPRVTFRVWLANGIPTVYTWTLPT